MESEPGLLMVVTPDKNVVSLDGHLPMDIMTGINFNNRMPRKITHKNYPNSKNPYFEKVKRGEASRSLYINCNED